MMQRIKVAVGVIAFVLAALCAWGGVLSNRAKNVTPTPESAAAAPITTPTPSPLIVPTVTLAPVATVTPIATAAPTSVPSTQPAVTRESLTETPSPAATVLVPETMEGLVSILLQPGDLPVAWKLDDEVYNEAPVDYDGPRPVAIANASLVEGNSKFASGGVVVYLFASEADAGKAFDARSDVVTRNIDKGATVLHPPYGQRSMLAPGFGKVFGLDQLVFQRCRVVVEMQLGLRANGALVGQYAPRLDDRLAPTACR